MSDQPFYDAELAATHDADFTHVARAAAKDLLAALDAAGHDAGTVVDLGCGSGVLAAIVADAGYDVLGVDVSPAMIEIARLKAPTARFECASVWDFAEPGATIPEAVAVAAVGEVVNYAVDERAGVAALRTLLGAVHETLVPGGVLLFDVATPGRAGPGGSVSAFHDRPAYAMWFSARELPSAGGGPGTLERTMVLFEREGGLYRRTDEVHRLRLYDPAQIDALLRDAGFEVTVLDGYGSLPLSDGWVAFLARRTG